MSMIDDIKVVEKVMDGLHDNLSWEGDKAFLVRKVYVVTLIEDNGDEQWVDSIICKDYQDAVDKMHLWFKENVEAYLYDATCADLSQAEDDEFHFWFEFGEHHWDYHLQAVDMKLDVTNL